MLWFLTKTEVDFLESLELYALRKKKILSFKSLINSYIYPLAVYNLIISYNKAQQY